MSNQEGGWYENTFDDFREECIGENDKFRQTEEWWDNLKNNLNYYASNMSQQFMAEPRFARMPMGEVQDSLDLLVILLLDISRGYASLLVNNTYPDGLINLLNRRTVNLKNTVNSDFVEFVQILLKIVKTTEKFGEANTLTLGHLADDPTFTDFTTEASIRSISENIISNNSDRGIYGLYKDHVLDSVRLLEVFLLKAYTGVYGEIQARDIVCQDYFFDTLQNYDDIIEWVRYYEQNPDDQMELLNELKFKRGDHILSKPEIKTIWEGLYNSINVDDTDNLNQSDRVAWKEILNGWKYTMKVLLYSTLLNRNDYKFFRHPNLQHYRDDFDKDIYKTYAQFQVKLALFYKRLLTKFLGGYETYEEYVGATTDAHKNKKQISSLFIDIIKCIQYELEAITGFIHPRNTEVDEDDDPFPSTRFTHLHDESLQIDQDDDSDDEMERIGQDYISHVDGNQFIQKIQSVKILLNTHNLDDVPIEYLRNVGKRCTCSVKLDGDIWKTITPDSLILGVNDEDHSTEIEDTKYVYSIETGGVDLSDKQVVTLSVDDPSITNIRDNTEFNIGDDVYFINYSKFGDTIQAFLLSGTIKDVSKDDGYVTIEMSDDGIEQQIGIDEINLTEFGAIINELNNLANREKLNENKVNKLENTFQTYLYANHNGEPTYHLEYSADRRGNPRLDTALRSRGFDGLNYLNRKITRTNEKNTIDADELRRLRGDNPPKTSVFPERIGYLETIMENDKEFKTPTRRKARWEREPYAWDSDEEMEEDFDGQRRLDRFINRRRRGISRPLQRNSYRSHGLHNIIGRNTSDEVLGEIPSNLLEDNPIFRKYRLKQLLNKRLRKRYNLRSRSNLPARRLDLSQQIRDRYSQSRPMARDLAERIDREIEQRTLAEQRRERDRVSDELEQLINRQRTALSLRDQLRSRDFATTDNIRREIDTMRDVREREMRSNREREDAALSLQRHRRRNLTRRRQR